MLFHDIVVHGPVVDDGNPTGAQSTGDLETDLGWCGEDVSIVRIHDVERTCAGVDHHVHEVADGIRRGKTLQLPDQVGQIAAAWGRKGNPGLAAADGHDLQGVGLAVPGAAGFFLRFV